MEYQELSQKVDEWIKSCGQELSCQKTESENKLTLWMKDEESLSFEIVCAEDIKDWTVSSESVNRDIVDGIMSIQDFIDSRKEKSIQDILNRLHTFLRKGKQNLEICRSKDDNDENHEDCDDEDNDCNDDDDDDDEGYYMEPDEDADQEPIPKKEESEDEAENFYGGIGSPAATHRLLKDLKTMQAATKFGIEGKPKGDNLFHWDVKLKDLPLDTCLGKDLQKYAERHGREPVIYLEMQFPPEYPMSPPFVRVIRPRFQFLTGHVTIGGSICMEMLTKSGWRPINDIEGILVQIRSEIMSDPKARLSSEPDKEYTEEEAKEAFKRMVQRYKWN